MQYHWAETLTFMAASLLQATLGVLLQKPVYEFGKKSVQATAQNLVKDHNGVIPSKPASLLTKIASAFQIRMGF